MPGINVYIIRLFRLKKMTSFSYSGAHPRKNVHFFSLIFCGVTLFTRLSEVVGEGEMGRKEEGKKGRWRGGEKGGRNEGEKERRSEGEK